MVAMNSVFSLLLLTLLVSGCTATPERYKKNASTYGQSASVAMQDSSKMQALANASVAVPQQYVDRDTGMTTYLILESEYFSANGRQCRRFKQGANAQQSGVACQDARGGWVELPLATLLR